MICLRSQSQEKVKVGPESGFLVIVCGLNHYGLLPLIVN